MKTPHEVATEAIERRREDVLYGLWLLSPRGSRILLNESSEETPNSLEAERGMIQILADIIEEDRRQVALNGGGG